MTHNQIRPAAGRLRYQGRKQQQGLATLEVTLVTPLLLLIMLATAEFGRAMYQYQTLTQSLRHAAIELSRAEIDLSDPAAVDDAQSAWIKHLAVYGTPCPEDPCSGGYSKTPVLPGLSSTDVSITPSAPGFIRLQADYSWQPMFGATLPLTAIDLSFPLSASITVRAL